MKMRSLAQHSVCTHRYYLFLILFLLSFAVHAQDETSIEELNTIRMTKTTLSLRPFFPKDVMFIRLPLYPEDPEAREAFMSLSAQEQKAFYWKRRFLIQKLAGGMLQPGVKSGIRWVKDKITAFRSRKQSRSTVAEIIANEAEAAPLDVVEDADLDKIPEDDTKMKWVEEPAKLSDKTKAVVERTISAFTDNFWKNSVSIAKSNALGFTLVGGAIFNVSLGTKGYVVGRSFSLDVGVDFSSNEGYIRVLYDRQALKKPGLSFDVGLMADALIHVTDSKVSKGSEIEATHVKLPLVGCFRYGPNYKAWGLQLGLSVIEIAGGALAAFGHPEALSLIPIMRVVGAMTIYSTTLDRKVLGSWKLPLSWLFRLGFLNPTELKQMQGTNSTTSGSSPCREKLNKNTGS